MHRQGYPRLAEKIERLTPARLIFVGTGQGKLNITEAMVKAGITKVFRKLDIRNRPSRAERRRKFGALVI